MNRRLVLVAAALAVALVGSACNDDSESAAPALPRRQRPAMRLT
jgi:hypothetical protein